jgi:predicted PurR-regulated permease PerM
MASDPEHRPNAFQKGFLLVAVAGISWLFLSMVETFLMALLLGAITAGLTHPLYRRLLRPLGGRSMLASACIVVALILLVIGPFSALIGLVVAQAVEVTQEVGPWVEAQIADPAGFSALVEKLPFSDWIPESILPEREKLFEIAGNAVRSTGSTLVDGLAAAGRGTATFLIQVFIFLYAVFFFLVSGREILDRILYLSPLESDDEALIIERFLSVTRATLRGSLLIGGIQGVMVGSAFAIAGVRGAAFWGTIVVVLSVIPGVGAPIVWIPAAIWLLASGHALSAGLLALWCGLVVGSIDNVLRPRLVGSDARMSDLMILISTLGGISLFGAVGFIVGPIVAAVFVTLWDMYGRAFAGSLPALAAADALLGSSDGPGSAPTGRDVADLPIAGSEDPEDDGSQAT